MQSKIPKNEMLLVKGQRDKEEYMGVISNVAHKLERNITRKVRVRVACARGCTRVELWPCCVVVVVAAAAGGSGADLADGAVVAAAAAA